VPFGCNEHRERKVVALTQENAVDLHIGKVPLTLTMMVGGNI
jgi:hypothetical protein